MSTALSTPGEDASHTSTHEQGTQTPGKKPTQATATTGEKTKLKSGKCRNPATKTTSAAEFANQKRTKPELTDCVMGLAKPAEHHLAKTKPAKKPQFQKKPAASWTQTLKKPAAGKREKKNTTKRWPLTNAEVDQAVEDFAFDFLF